MIRIRRMTSADIPIGMRLKAQAGWNQLTADWHRFLALAPNGCFVADYDDKPAGTTTTCIFGSVAWIAMVLVEQELRGRGIGRALMEHALAYLDRRGVRTVRLDATRLGQPLYAKLGFRRQFTLLRYEGEACCPGIAPASLTARPRDHAQLMAYDREVTHTDRRQLIECWLAGRPVRLLVLADREPADRGFVAIRPGARAWQIGPCIAAKAGARLLEVALRRRKWKRVIVDTPLRHRAARRVLEAHGLSPQRELARMCRGVPVSERLDELWASSGPEMG